MIAASALPVAKANTKTSPAKPTTTPVHFFFLCNIWVNIKDLQDAPFVMREVDTKTQDQQALNTYYDRRQATLVVPVFLYTFRFIETELYVVCT
jgi:hypothetical protein